MDIRLANLAYYHGLEQKLIDDIKQVRLVISGSQNYKFKILFLQLEPAIIMLAFCYSINGDMALLLRACGLFSKMIIKHDLKIITRNHRASLNPVQEKLLTKIGKSQPFNWKMFYISIFFS